MLECLTKKDLSALILGGHYIAFPAGLAHPFDAAHVSQNSADFLGSSVWYACPSFMIFHWLFLPYVVMFYDMASG